MLNWKLYLENPAEAEPDEFFKVLSGWIPNSPEVYIDVADYQHVQDGPVTLLVGHYVNYSLDSTGRRLGLLADFKQPLEGTNVFKLTHTLLGLLNAAKRLEDDVAFSHRPKFDASEIRFIINSRALAPNTAETFEAVKPELMVVLEKAYGNGNVTVERLTETKQRFMVQIKSKVKTDLNQLIQNLS